MGVLNVSPESPYKPSVFDDAGEAAEYVDRSLVDQGADIVDVGLESANKRFEVLSVEEELDRLDLAVETIHSVSCDPVFSIETRYHEVAEAALSRGFDMVNDICGFADPKMPRVCAEHDAAVVKMASPPNLRRPGAVDDVDWADRKSDSWADAATYVDKLYEALRQRGFTDQTIVDPAFGGWSKAKTLADDRETLERLREFRGFGYPILVSINRKNFLRQVAGRETEKALPVSLAATSMAVERGAHVVRTHDVAETRDAALIGATFARDRVRDSGEVSVEELDVTTVREGGRHVERVGGDPPAAAGSVVRVFELGGLAAEEHRALSTAVADEGAATLVSAVHQPTNERANTDRGARDSAGTLLFGTPRSLRRVVAAAEGTATALDGALDRIESGLAADGRETVSDGRRTR